MYEIRFKLKSLNSVLRQVEKLGAKEKQRFQFSDNYYHPKKPGELWGKGLATIRYRKFSDTSKLLYSRYNSIKVNGFVFIKNIFGSKIEIFDDEAKAMDFIDSLGLKCFAEVRRQSGVVYTLKHKKIIIEFTVEDIINYGISSEIELLDTDLENEDYIEVVRFFQDKFDGEMIDCPLIKDFMSFNDISFDN